MIKKNNKKEDYIQKIIDNPELILRFLQEGVYAALLRHKQAGNPICEWRDGKVVWIPPEKILQRSN